MGDMPPGSVFAGHRIEAVAGRGGMGVVYRACQLSLDRVVALKVIAPALMQDDGIRRRFVRESRIAASIDHPNVIPIYYTGEEDGVAYIAMRYVAGDDLRTLIRRSGRIDAPRAAAIVNQVAAALDVAHASGLVHRDVKPANVLLGPGDHVYLTDFGLTKHVQSEAGATRSGHWVGTLDFVAPEQIRGERVDGRADVYGLGCLLHYALTGAPPFPREGEESKLWAHLSEPPPQPSASAPELPAALDDVVGRALAKSPDDRFPSAGDLGRAALAAASGTSVEERERMVAIGAAAPVEADTRSAVRRQPSQRADVPEPRRRRRTRTALMATAGIAAAVALVLALENPFGDRSHPQPPVPATGTQREPTAPPASLARSVKLGGRLNTVAVAGGHVWTGAFRRPKLDALAESTGRRLPKLRPEVGIGLSSLSAAGGTLWALATRAREVVALDAATGRRVGPPIRLQAVASAVAATKDAVWVAVTTHELDPGDEILRFDPRTRQLQETLFVTDGVRRLVVSQGGLWLLASTPARIVRIDLRTRARRKFKPESQRTGDLAAGAGMIWATLRDRDQVIRIDPRTGNITYLAVGHDPVGLVVSHGLVWVANRASNTVTRIDARTGRVKDELQVPLNPQALAAGDGAVWVTSLAEGKVTRLPDAVRGRAS